MSGLSLAAYARADAAELFALVRSGAATHAELLAHARVAAQRVNPALGAIVEMFGDVAPDGVPLLVKDYGATVAGRTQECGSRLLAGDVAARDAHLTRRFRRAGFAFAGRSAAPEFALSLSTESVLHGPTRNPWNPERLAGGSSGGAAAAVAAGIVPVAHATDAAGSIRIPASACGVVGLKPSRGRVSFGPDVGDPLLGMNTELAITRSVRDAALVLDAASGPEPGDPFALPTPPRSFADVVAAAPHERPRALRIAWTAGGWGGNAADPEVADATARTARLLGDLGHAVVAASPAFDYDAFVEAACVGWALGFDVLLEDHAARRGRPLDASTLEPVTLSLYERAASLTAREVARAEAILNRVRRDVGAFFVDVDVLLTPTLLRPPEPLGLYAQTVAHPDFEAFFRFCDRSAAMLPLFNATGQPAVSLPLAWSAAGLPLGMQLVARPGEEALLLRLAADLERAAPWRDRLPPIHASHAG